MELTCKLGRMCQGEDANAMSSALITMLGLLVAKHCKSEAEAVKLCSELSGDFTRNALEFMGEGHQDA